MPLQMTGECCHDVGQECWKGHGFFFSNICHACGHWKCIIISYLMKKGLAVWNTKSAPCTMPVKLPSDRRSASCSVSRPGRASPRLIRC